MRITLPNNDRYIFLMIVFFVFLISLILVPVGTLVTPDSAAYISAAKGLVYEGRLLLFDGTHLVHWPPLTSLFLTPAFIFNIPIFWWAHFESALIISLVSGVLYLTLCELIQNRSWAAGAAVLFAMWQPILMNFIYIWSEPLFLLFAGVSILIFLRWSRTFSWPLFMVLMASSGLALMTRYSGIFLVIGIVLSMFPMMRLPFFKKLGVAILYLLGSFLPMIVYLLQSFFAQSAISDRSIMFHGINSYNLLYLPVLFLTRTLYWGEYVWMLPVSMLFFALLIVGYLQVRMSISIEKRKSLAVIYIVAFCYLLFLFLTNVFVDSLTLFDIRQLVFVFYCLFLIVIFQLFCIRSYLKTIMAFLRLVYVLSGAMLFISFFGWVHFIEITYETQQSQQDQLASIRIILSTVGDRKLYSNIPDMVYIATGRAANFLPRKFSAAHRVQRPEYDTEVKKLQEDIQDGALLFLEKQNFRWYLMSEKAIQALGSLKTVYEDKRVVLLISDRQ